MNFLKKLFCETIFLVWQRQKSKRYYVVCYVFYPENLIIILEHYGLDGFLEKNNVSYVRQCFPSGKT